MDNIQPLLASLLDFINVHLCVIDTQGQIVYCNHAWNEFGKQNGCSKEWVGENYFSVCAGAYEQGDTSAGLVYEGIKSVIDGRQATFEIEYPCHSPTEKRWFQLHVKKQFIQNKTFIFLSHSQFQAESEVRAFQERLNLATSAAKIGVWELNLSQGSLYWDDTMFDIYGVSPDKFERAYSAWVAAVHPEDIKSAEQDFKDSIKYHQPFNSQFRIIRGDGKTRHIEAHANLLRNKRNEAIKIVGINVDVTDKVLHQNRIKELAFTDELTQLPNRNQLVNDFEIELEKFKFVSICLLNINHFRSVNDFWGQKYGDELLTKFAMEMSTAAAPHFTAYRTGGDEFVLLQFSEQLIDKELINKIINNLRKRADEILTITFSAGAVSIESNNQSFNSLMRKGDYALKGSKNTSGTPLIFYQNSMGDNYKRSMAIAKALPSSLHKGEFSVVIQPQFRADMSLYGGEVLSRWHNEKLGDVSPAEFIPIAEKSNYILKMGNFVFEQACQLVKTLSANNEIVISVNVSPVQLYSPEFFSFAEHILELYEIPPNRIKLEITEGVLIENTEVVLALIKKLKGLGIQFALDDFGTGFSSLAYLKDIPLDLLKIDKSFINNIEDEKQYAITAAILRLGEGLKQAVIAEGIETETQFNILKKMGVKLYQGFWFEKPMLFDDFITLVSRKK